MIAPSSSTANPMSSSSSPTWRHAGLEVVQTTFNLEMGQPLVTKAMKEMESDIHSRIFLPLVARNSTAVPTVSLTNLISMLIDAHLLPSDLPSEFRCALQFSLSLRSKMETAVWDKIELDFESLLHTLLFVIFYFSPEAGFQLESSDTNQDIKRCDALQNFMQSVIEHIVKDSVPTTPLFQTPMSQFQTPAPHGRDSMQPTGTARSERWYTPHEKLLPRVLDLDVTPASSLSGTLSSIDPNTLPRNTNTASSSFNTPALSLNLVSFGQSMQTPLSKRLSVSSHASSDNGKTALTISTDSRRSCLSRQETENSAGHQGTFSDAGIVDSMPNLSNLKESASNVCVSSVEGCQGDVVQSCFSLESQLPEVQTKLNEFQGEQKLGPGQYTEFSIEQPLEFGNGEESQSQEHSNHADDISVSKACENGAARENVTASNLHMKNQSISCQGIPKSPSAVPQTVSSNGHESCAIKTFVLERKSNDVSDIDPDDDKTITSGDPCNLKTRPGLETVRDTTSENLDAPTNLTDLDISHQKAFIERPSLVDNKDILCSVNFEGTDNFEGPIPSLSSNQEFQDLHLPENFSVPTDNNSRITLKEQTASSDETPCTPEVTSDPSQTDTQPNNRTSSSCEKSKPQIADSSQTGVNDKSSEIELESALPPHTENSFRNFQQASAPVSGIDVFVEEFPGNRGTRSLPVPESDTFAEFSRSEFGINLHCNRDTNDLQVVSNASKQKVSEVTSLSKKTTDFNCNSMELADEPSTSQTNIEPVRKCVNFEQVSNQPCSTINNFGGSVPNTPKSEIIPAASGLGATSAQEECNALQDPTSPLEFLSPELSDAKLERCITNLSGREQRVLNFGSKEETSEKDSSDYSSSYSENEVIPATKLCETTLKDFGEAVDDSALSEHEQANQELTSTDIAGGDKADRTYDTSFFENSEEILAHSLWEEENDSREDSHVLCSTGLNRVAHDNVLNVVPTQVSAFETLQSFASNSTDVPANEPILYSDPSVDEYDTVSEDRCVIVSDMVSKTGALFDFEKESYTNENDTMKSTNSLKRMVKTTEICSKYNLTMSDHRGSFNAGSTNGNYEDDTLTLDGLDDLTEDVEMIGEQSVSSSDLTPAGLAMMRREAWEAIATRQDDSTTEKWSNAQTNHQCTDVISARQPTAYDDVKRGGITASSGVLVDTIPAESLELKHREVGNYSNFDSGEMVELMKSMSDIVRQNLLVCQQVKEEMLQYRRKASKNARTPMRDVSWILVSFLLLTGLFILLSAGLTSIGLLRTKVRFSKVFV